jgi:hypothetical protein
MIRAFANVAKPSTPVTDTSSLCDRALKISEPPAHHSSARHLSQPTHLSSENNLEANFMHLPRGFGLVSILALLVPAPTSARSPTIATMAKTISIASAPQLRSSTWS